MFIAPLTQFGFQLYQERNLIPLLRAKKEIWETNRL